MDVLKDMKEKAEEQFDSLRKAEVNARAVTKSGIAEALSTDTELKKNLCRKLMNSLAVIASSC